MEKLDVNLERFINASMNDLGRILKSHIKRKDSREHIQILVHDKIEHMLDIIDTKKIKP